MRKSRLSEDQIIGVLCEQEAGATTAEVCRRHGISEQAFYRWKAKYAGMTPSDVAKLKALEDENRRLKKLLAEARDRAAADRLRHLAVSADRPLPPAELDQAGLFGVQRQAELRQPPSRSRRSQRNRSASACRSKPTMVSSA